MFEVSFAIVAGVVLVAVLMWADKVAARKKRIRKALDDLATKLNSACEHCEHFDLEEGQAVMQQNPAFMQAAQHVAPNTMMRRLDENGNELPNEHALLAKQNSWRFFGACSEHGQLRHCADRCDKFCARKVQP